MANIKISDYMADFPKDNTTKQTITYHLLKEALIHHEFKPGMTLTERKLCAYFGVSRPPVHNAVQQLIAEGLLCIDSGSIVVPTITFSELKELFEMLELLQVSAFSSQSNPFLHNDYFEMKDMLNKMYTSINDSSQSPFDRYVLDQKFHTKIISLSDNKRLKSCFETYSNQYAPYSSILFSMQNWRDHTYQIHEEIYKAIEKQSVDTFKRHLHNHYAMILSEFKILTEKKS